MLCVTWNLLWECDTKPYQGSSLQPLMVVASLTPRPGKPGIKAQLQERWTTEHTTHLRRVVAAGDTPLQSYYPHLIRTVMRSCDALTTAATNDTSDDNCCEIKVSVMINCRVFLWFQLVSEAVKLLKDLIFHWLKSYFNHILNFSERKFKICKILCVENVVSCFPSIKGLTPRIKGN